ncbi:unnamed protein product [Durusdinium trenchii]|uniref:Uncharacterized protein n=1 Tax=Durusdinium trenchii TaxID=1381693 RepID=A0ABP0MPD3_9DINO
MEPPEPLQEMASLHGTFSKVLAELEELHVAEVQQLQSQVWELQKRLGEGFGPRCESPVKAIQANPDSNPRRSEIVDSKECVQCFGWKPRGRSQQEHILDLCFADSIFGNQCFREEGG